MKLLTGEPNIGGEDITSELFAEKVLGFEEIDDATETQGQYEEGNTSLPNQTEDYYNAQQ